MKKWALGILAIAVLASAYAWASYGPKTATLTFDDGPGDSVADAQILAVLEKHHAKAVWFVNCKWLAQPEHRAMLQRIAAEGHAIGNHGYDHLKLATLTPAQTQHEVGGCSDAILAVTGKAPVYFRPAWGKVTPEARRVMAAKGMQEMLWSADSMDHAVHFYRDKPQVYAQFLADNPANDVARTAQSGDVILFHDYRDTAGTLDATLTRLEGRGFRFRLPENP